MVTSTSAARPSSTRALAKPLLQRLGLLAFFLIAEWLPISALISTGRGGQSLARALVAFGSLFFAFGYWKGRSAIAKIAREIEGTPIGWKFLTGHFCSMAVFLGLSLSPFSKSGPHWQAALISATWLSAGSLGIILSAFAFVPPRYWTAFVRATGHLWIFAAVAAAIAWRFVIPLWSVWDAASWKPAVDLTFGLTKSLLKPFLRDLVADPAAAQLGTPRFTVTIGGACSGIEGAGLMLVFSVGWLWFFRRECRFPQALLLVPASIVVLWLLNAVRLACLILIGNAGAPQIAMGGFHSQAGWIAFNLVAIGLLVATRRVPWWSRQPVKSSHRVAASNPTAKYLLPFIAILTAGMIAHSASAGFEWLYPLRLFAAATLIWIFRSQYKRMDWRCGWLGPLLGALAFVVWMSFDGLRGPQPASGLSMALTGSSSLARITWLVCRTVAAVVTVPIAEELAFRGFLIRRLMASDFESLGLRSFNWMAVLVSSAVFGLLHGGRWIEGTIAGAIYAMALLHRGRIGEAVVAHATTNALLAMMVLVRGAWYLW